MSKNKEAKKRVTIIFRCSPGNSVEVNKKAVALAKGAR
jgi:hypothetical protein